MSEPPLRIATWNVLADAFVKPDRYVGIPPRIFEPPVRRARVLARAVESNADVLCLQEVDAALFDALAAALPDHERLGAPRGGRRPDGVAILVRRSRLTIHASRAVDAEGTVALIAELGELRVATVHIDWDPPDAGAKGSGGPEAPHGSAPGARSATKREMGKGRAQMQALLPLLGAPHGIFCGDFNAAAGSETMRLVREAGWLDARKGSPFATGAANGHLNAVDWLLHGPELDAAYVSPLANPGVRLPDDAEPSDHVVVAADFRPRP